MIHITDTTVFDESEIQERVVRAAIELRLDLGPGVVKRHRRASPGQEKSTPVMKNPRLVAWPAEQG